VPARRLLPTTWALRGSISNRRDRPTSLDAFNAQNLNLRSKNAMRLRLHAKAYRPRAEPSTRAPHKLRQTPIDGQIGKKVSYSHSKVARDTVYAVTSLPPKRGGPSQLLALSRAHWEIENCMHHVRDVNRREDRARASAGNAPQVLAAFRSTMLTRIRRLGYKIVEGFEYFAEHRPAAIEAARGWRTE
jgi:predicted transposase YbfD/YdcC